jgi:phosphocarrier protein HPr
VQNDGNAFSHQVPDARSIEEDPMPTRTVVVASRIGLHARPASLVSLAAAGTGVPVVIEAHGRSVNAASILGILSLDVNHGDEVAVSADDPAAVDALIALLERDLSED